MKNCVCVLFLTRNPKNESTHQNYRTFAYDPLIMIIHHRELEMMYMRDLYHIIANNAASRSNQILESDKQNITEMFEK